MFHGKYIMTNDCHPHIFSHKDKHSDEAIMLLSAKQHGNNIVSAGFWKTENGEIHTYGHSESLGLKIAPIDADILNAFFKERA